MLDGHLGQKQAAMSRHTDEQAMASDFDDFDGNWLRQRKDAELDFHLCRFWKRDWTEPRVFEGRGPSGICDCAIDGTYRQNVTDASSQLAAPVKRCECSARFREMCRWWIERDLAPFERGENGVMGEAQKYGALVLRELAFIELAGIYGNRTRS